MTMMIQGINIGRESQRPRSPKRHTRAPLSTKLYTTSSKVPKKCEKKCIFRDTHVPPRSRHLDRHSIGNRATGTQITPMQ